MHNEIGNLLRRYPDIEPCGADIERAISALEATFRGGGKLLVCGNGGSAADAEHIAGELMKGFRSKRPVDAERRELFLRMFSEDGDYLADHLQGALPTIALAGGVALSTAFSNDVAADMVFAQQVYGFGRNGDALLAISTSGGSPNVIRAAQVAKSLGLRTVALTGEVGGRLAKICDVAIRVPFRETSEVQERHLPIYHTICLELERTFFPS